MKCVLKENRRANQPADNGRSCKAGASEWLNALSSGNLRTVSSPQILMKPLFLPFKTKWRQQRIRDLNCKYNSLAVFPYVLYSVSQETILLKCCNIQLAGGWDTTTARHALPADKTWWTFPSNSHYPSSLKCRYQEN